MRVILLAPTAERVQSSRLEGYKAKNLSLAVL